MDRSSQTVYWKCAFSGGKVLPLLLLMPLLILSLQVFGQSTNLKYERADLTPDPLKYLHADLDMLPNSDEFIVTATQGNDLVRADAGTMTAIKTIGSVNWYAGSKIDISSDGKYMLLQQLFYLDYKPNKDREVKFQVNNIETGKTVIDLPSAHAAQLHPNNKELIVLEGDEVYSYPLDGSGRKSLFPVAEATNCVAISPDGKYLAVSHKPEDGFLNSFLTKKGQRKNFKLFKKYRQCISVYDAKTFERLYTVDDMYDLPYVLSFSPNSDYLLCYSVPHSKLQSKSGAGNTKYINKIDCVAGKPTRDSFVSNAMYEPDFEFSNDGKYLAVSTTLAGGPEVMIYTFDDARIVARFQMGTRLFEGIGRSDYPADGRVGFDFTSDDRYLVMTSGSIIIKWEIPYENQ